MSLDQNDPDPAIPSAAPCSATGPIDEIRLQLGLATRMLDAGFFRIDLLRRRCRWDDRTCDLHGLPTHGAPGTLDQWCALLRPGEGTEFARLVERCVAGGAHGSLRYGVGSTHLEAHVDLLRDESGDACAVVGLVVDCSGRAEEHTRPRLSRNMIDPLDDAERVVSRNHLQAIVDATSDCIMVTDADGHIVDINHSGLAMLRARHAHEVIGRRLLMFVVPECRDRAKDYHQRVCAGQRDRLELEIRTLDGERRWIETSALRIPRESERHDAGSFLVMSVTRDITERKRTEVMKDEYAMIVESASDAIFSKNMDGVIQSWNPGARAMFGYEAHEIIGKHVTELMPSDVIPEESGIIERIKSGERVEHIETVRRAKSGQIIEVSLTISPIWNSHGQVIGASKVMRDITSRRRAERELARTREALRRVDERRQLTLFERERARLGRELHDGIGQMLTGVAFLTKALESKALGNVPADPADARWIVQSLNSIIEQVRFMSRNLSPMEIDDNSITAALERLAADFRSAFGISVSVEVKAGIPELSRDVLTQYFRIAQEALSNAVRHGRATRIAIRLHRAGDHMVLVIGDNGCGFENDPGDHRTGLGLRSMRIRAESLKGRLRFRSGVRGTSVVVRATPEMVND